MLISQMLTRRRSQALTVSLIALASLTACAGSGSSSTTAGSTPTSTASSTSPGGTSTKASPHTSPKPSTAQTVAPVPVESNPPGDIPDNLAFVPYRNAAGGYSFTHPEGWAQTGKGTQVQFTDKLNGVAVDVSSASKAPTVASAKSTIVPQLQRSVPAFEQRSVSTVTVPAGPGVRIVFRRNSEPDPVTGKVYRDEVEEYLVFKGGTQVAMDLYGPVGADNVDAYRTMSQSLSIR